MDTVLKLLEEMEEMIELSKATLFSSKVSIDKDELFEIITEIRLRFPHELKQAKWVLEERNKILLEAQKEADEIIKNAEDRFERMVDEHEITKNAYQMASEIVDNAKEMAKEIRLGANEYADHILSDLELRLGQSLKVIQEQHEMNHHYYNDILEIIHENRTELSDNNE